MMTCNDHVCFLSIILKKTIINSVSANALSIQAPNQFNRNQISCQRLTGDGDIEPSPSVSNLSPTVCHIAEVKS